MILQPGCRPVPNCPDYVLVRKRGAGAFGEVWHTRGPGDLDVALKFIRLDARASALELRSLEVMKSIRHPNLVSLFGAWHKDSWLILAMELCDRTLQDRLTEALGQKLPGIPVEELLGYMRDAANGLDALNAKQVQHRDVKPANLLLLDSGVKVADFGLAKVLEQTVATNSGAGTLAYTAPECFKGQLAQQSDQYSLGVTYYHLRTGRLPFRGDQAQVVYAHLELEPDLSPLLPAERMVLARALCKEPGKRWPNCKALANELTKAHQPARDEPPNANAIFYYKRSFTWNANREYDKAIQDLDEAIRLNPRYADAYALRGFVKSSKEDKDGAIKDFTEAIRFEVERKDLACHYRARGNIWKDKKDYERAMEDFNAAMRLDPLDPWAFINRGDAWLDQKEYNKAIVDYDDAIIRLKLVHAPAYYNRGIAWAHLMEYDQAIRDFDKAIRLDPKDALAYASRGMAWFKKQDFGKAIKDYDEALRLNPKDAATYSRRGRAKIAKKDYDNGISDFNHAVRLNPNCAFAQGYYAWVLATHEEGRIRNGKLAIFLATRTCELTEWKDGGMVAILSAAYAEAGQFDEAICYQMKALEDPACRGRAGDNFRQRLELYRQRKPFRQSY